MTVYKDVTELDSVGIIAGQAIKSSTFLAIFNMLNALYEGLVDASCPDGGTQTYAGHDHADEGGAGIINNCQITIDQGANPIFEKTDFSLSGKAVVNALLGKYYVSPNLKTQGQTFVEIAICYASFGSTFLVSSLGGTPKELQDTGDGGAAWSFFKAPIARDKDYVDLYLDIQPDGDTTGDSIEFKIFCVQVVETYESSQPKIGYRSLIEARSDETFYRYFGEALATELVENYYPLTADTLKRTFSALNALAEVCLDKSCPGVASSSQLAIGHDHTDQYLGRAIGHGKIYSAGTDNGRYKLPFTSLYIWEPILTVVNQWYYADSSSTYRRTTSGSSPGGTPTTYPMFTAPVTRGISSTGNPPSAAPYLDGWVFICADFPGSAIELKIYNQTTGTFSETINPTLAAWSYIRFIPCSGDSWNDFDIQVRKIPPAGGNTLHVCGLVIAEAYEYNGNKGAYISSTGSRLLGVPSEGVRKVQV